LLTSRPDFPLLSYEWYRKTALTLDPVQLCRKIQMCSFFPISLWIPWIKTC